MANTSSAKGNPASHRMSNKNLQAKRQRCWNNGQRRKDLNRAENLKRAERNKGIRALGTLDKRTELALGQGSDPSAWGMYLTPHEAQRLQRKLRRAVLKNRGLVPANAEMYHKKHGRPNSTPEPAKK
jgi:hypothetical protein